MKLTEDRISHMAHLIWDALYEDDLADYPDETKALLGIKGAIQGYLRVDDEIDDRVREKINSLKRGVAEGSPEWDILYHKYYEEEALKKKF
jgi:hypothetical protein